MDNEGQLKNSTSKMSVKEIEARLDYLAEFDIKNPEIYELLKQLATIFIFQNKYVYGYSDIDYGRFTYVKEFFDFVIGYRLKNGKTKD